MSSSVKLPDFSRISDAPRSGRNIRQGYERGWGLQFGDLAAQIRADGLYQEAFEISHGRSVQSEMNRMNIYLLMTHYMGALPLGHIAEFGAFRGGSAIFMAKVCQVLHPGMRIYAFDTFAGMPATDRAVDAHNAGDFANVDLPELRDYAASLGLDNLTFVQGLFSDTLPGMRSEIAPLRFVHIDADIKSACEDAYEGTKDLFVPGGYLAFDDALFSSCIGATELVEEVLIARDGLRSEQIFPQFVFRMGGGLSSCSAAD